MCGVWRGHQPEDRAISPHLSTLPPESCAPFPFLSQPPPRCLALEALARLALMPEVLAGVKHHMPTISDALKDPDVSIRKKAMDLLFTMCDASNASSLVGDLLAYLVRL